MRPKLLFYARRRLAFDADLPAELVDGVALEFLERGRTSAPSTWLQEEPPPGPDQLAFHRYIWTIVVRRVHDQLRARYRQLHAVDELRELQFAPSYAEIDQALDARRFVRALQQRLEELSKEDRELLLHRTADAPAPPRALSGAERIQLHRLRRKLAQLLKEDLKL